MDVDTITMDPDAAKEKLRATRRAVRARNAADLDEVKKRMNKEDTALLRGYDALAKGKVLINLGKSITDAGRDESGRPRLAVVRADAPWCTARFSGDEVTFWRASRQRGRGVVWDGNVPSFSVTIPREGTSWLRSQHALVPTVPPELRPRAAMHRFLILWEAEWQDVPPVDPMLLRPLAGDLYVVEAHWDLTPLEQAVLAGRIG